MLYEKGNIPMLHSAIGRHVLVLLGLVTLAIWPFSQLSLGGSAAAAELGDWSPTVSMRIARSAHTATLLPNGTVLLAGGIGVSSVEIYNPATQQWSFTDPLPTANQFHSATLLPNGKVLVTGGSDGSHAMSTAEIYDPMTSTWRQTGSLHVARVAQTATVLPDGKVLVAGGTTNGFDGIASAELYDPTSGTWSRIGSMHTPRKGHTATLLPNGKVLVVGGTSISSDSHPFLQTAELYDPTNGTWSLTGSLANARAGHTTTLLPNGKVLVAGGNNGGSIYSSGNPKIAELYDPTTGTWSETGSLNFGRSSGAAALLPNGTVLVAGGSWNDASAEIYDPSTDTWNLAGSMETVRVGPTATLLLDGTVLVVGGSGPNGVGFNNSLRSAEIYTPDIVVGTHLRVKPYYQVLTSTSPWATDNYGAKSYQLSKGESDDCAHLPAASSPDSTIDPAQRSDPTPKADIWHCGCIMTDWAMIVNYYLGQVSHGTMSVTPRDLNNWLRDTPDGYQNGLWTNQYALPKYFQEIIANTAYEHTATLAAPQNHESNPELLKQLLDSGTPVVLHVANGSHWVLATGYVEDANGKVTWYINDPNNPNNMTLAAYDDTFATMQWVTLVPGTVSSLNSISANLASPAELLVTDALGRRTGVDPNTGNVYNEIPNTIYYTDSIAPAGATTRGHPVKIFDAWAPAGGDYTVQVIGTGSGVFHFSVATSDAAGNFTSNTYVGSTQSGIVDTFKLSYGAAAGSPTTLVHEDTQPPTTTAAVTPQPNAAGWNKADVTVSLNTTDIPDPGGPGVKEITFSAVGAQPIAQTMVSGSSAQVSIIAEGITTLTYGAVDNAGNQETPKTLVVQIDKVPPEASIKFDSTAKDLIVTGFDSMSGTASGSIAPSSVVPADWTAADTVVGSLDTNPSLQSARREAQASRLPRTKGQTELRTYQITDAAGNNLTLQVKVRRLGSAQLEFRVVSMQYNGNGVDTQQVNSGQFIWSANSTGNVKALIQHLIVGQGRDYQETVGIYLARLDQTLVLSAGRSIPSFTKGLTLLQITTDAGALTIRNSGTSGH